MPQNDSMGTEFQNAAEREDFNARLARARALKEKPPEETAPPPADPVKALEEKLPEDRRGKFVSYLQKMGRLGTEVNKGMIDLGAEAAGIQNSQAVGVAKGTAAFSGMAVPDMANAVLHPKNTIEQVPSGLLNAWNEINSFGNSLDIMAADALGYYPQAQIFDESGKLDPKFLNLADTAVQDRLRKDAPLQKQNNFAEPVSMTGGLVEGISQFMAPFGAYNKSLKAANILAKPGAWRELSRAALAGFMTDFTAFDPEMGRLTDVLDEMGMDVSAVEYLKSDEDDSEMEARFKTALEGLGLGAIGEVAMGIMRSGKAITKTKEALGDRLAYLERLDSEASTRIKDDIYAHGDPDGEKVQFSEPPKAQTVADIQIIRGSEVNKAERLAFFHGNDDFASVARAEADRLAAEHGLDAEELLRDPMFLERIYFDDLRQRRRDLGPRIDDAREAGDEALYQRLMDEEEALHHEIKAEKQRQKDVLKPKPVTEGERFYQQDYFDLNKAPDGGDKFAFGDAIPDRERFVAEETVARPAVDGDMFGFKTRAGDVGVKFNRGTTTSIIEWDWLDNISSGGESFRQRKINIQDTNELTSKVMAVIEADAKATNSPSYFFAGATEKLDGVYRRLVPKLAERMGYDTRVNDWGVLMTRKDVTAAYEARTRMNSEEPVSPLDRTARSYKDSAITQYITDQTGFQPSLGKAEDSSVARQLQQELDARTGKFAADGEGGAPRTGYARIEHLNELRKEAQYWYGDDYKKLEQSGRIQYARRASDIDPNWKNLDDQARGVTMPGGNVFIFTDTTVAGDMRGLILHEAAVHGGMEAMLGRQGFDRLLKSVEDLANSGEGAAIRAREQALRQIGADGDPRLVNEEALAYLVQNAPEIGIVKELISNVKAWVAKTFPKLIPKLKLNQVDYASLAIMALRREAIISGKVIAMFGKVGEVREFGALDRKVDTGWQMNLGEADRLDMQPDVRALENVDPQAKDKKFMEQVGKSADDMMHPKVLENLFRQMEGFDPFLWKDAVELAAQGASTPDTLRMLRNGMAAMAEAHKAASKEAVAKPLFSMKEAPGRLDDQLNRVVLDDVKSGRRGLSGEESAALIGAAERWASAVRRQQPQKARQLSDLIEQLKTRNSPEDMRRLVEIMDLAKETVPEPPSLLKFLRRLGGLKEAGGELGARDLNRVNLVNNRTGKDIDIAREAAEEAGYIQPTDDIIGQTTIEDLMDAIDREISGDKVYSTRDLDWVMEAAARRDMRSELDSLGIDPNQTRKQILSEFERVANLQEGEPVTLRDIENYDRAEKAANAKPGIGLPDRGLLGGNEVRINFNSIESSDDIKSIIGQLADAFKGEIEAGRGGARSNDQVIKDSKRLSAWDALNERRDGTPLTDAEVPAAQSLYIASAENVKQALDLAMKTGTDTAHYNARRAITMHRAIQAEIAGAKADASRALRAWSITRSSTAQARRELNSVLEAYGGKLDPEEAARLRTMMDADPTAADKAIRSMTNKVADIGGAILRFAWLSGPHTHVMNMAGNSLTMAYDIGIRLGVGVRGKILGDPELERQLGLALKEYAGVTAGVRAQFAAFAKSADYKRMGKRLQEAKAAAAKGDTLGALKRGASALAFDNPVSATFRGRFDDRGVSGAAKYGERGNDRAVSAEAFGMKQGTVGAKITDGVGAILSAPTDFLGFQDDFFKGINEMATRYRAVQEIVLEEMDNGLAREDADARFAELLENPPQGVLDEARAAAQRRTFTEPVGEGTRTIVKMRNMLNKLGFPLGHLLLPFVVTPSNILKYAFMNGPTGLLFKEIQEDLRAGGVRSAMAQHRIVTGTALLFIGMDMVANGTMTGKAPSDPGERELWQRAGKQEYSFQVGDKWVAYRRMEPVSTMLAIGADLQMIALNSELDDEAGQDFAELLGPVLGSAIQVISSKTYLTSAAEFVRFSEDPERYGPSYIERLFGSVGVPAIASQIEEIKDPQIREASNIMERWMSRLPGFSEELPTSRDIWGRARTVSSGVGQAYDALSPFAVKTQDAEPIDTELMRIGFYPRRPDKSITVQTPMGVSVAVNLRNRPDIWTRYIELSGNELKIFDGMGTKDYLNAVIEKKHPDAGDYYSLPDSSSEPVSKEWFINRRINQARQVARIELQREFRADLQAMAEAAVKSEKKSETLRQTLNAQ